VALALASRFSRMLSFQIKDMEFTALDSANAFVSPGVNSRGELVPSHGPSRRRLGDELLLNVFYANLTCTWSVVRDCACHRS
jgi:hypothetical protein